MCERLRWWYSRRGYAQGTTYPQMCAASPPCVGAADIGHSGVPLTFAEITKLWAKPITLGTVKKTRKNGKHTGANAQFGRKVRKSR